MKNRLYGLIAVCLIPLICMIVYLLALVNDFSERYDFTVKNITLANTYNITFKEDMDYLMYIIAANAERAGELVDVDKPGSMIDGAREDFYRLYESAGSGSSRESLKRIIKCLDIL